MVYVDPATGQLSYGETSVISSTGLPSDPATALTPPLRNLFPLHKQVRRIIQTSRKVAGRIRRHKPSTDETSTGQRASESDGPGAEGRGRTERGALFVCERGGGTNATMALGRSMTGGWGKLGTSIGRSHQLRPLSRRRRLRRISCSRSAHRLRLCRLRMRVARRRVQNRAIAHLPA